MVYIMEILLKIAEETMFYKDEIYSVKQITYILQDLSDSTKD